MDAQSAYSVHQADVERDRELILGLWRGNLGDDARMVRKYDWFYRNCPYGVPLVMLLRHEASGAWVGVASAGPRRMLMGGRSVLAGLLVDFTVLPAHRSLWPALSLQRALMDAALKRFELLYGFPNPKAAALFRQVGYVPVSRIARHARVLRHGDYLRTRMPAPLAAPAGLLLDLVDRLRLRARAGGLRARWQKQADEFLAALWTPADAGSGPVARRDLEFLRWRFDHSPLVEVRYLVASDAAGGVLAWFACEGRGRILYVHDFWSRRGAAGPAPAELAVLLRSAREAGHAAVSIELGAAAAIGAWASLGFAVRSQRPVFWHLSGVPEQGFNDHLWLSAADEDE